MKKFLNLLILLVNLQSGFSQSISSDSLVLHLPFNGNAKDISGNHYDGVVNGATLTTGENNLQGTAYYFDGKSSIVIPNLKKLDRPLKAFTILIKLMVTNLDIDPTVRRPFPTGYNFLYWHRNSPDSERAFLYSKIRASWQPASTDSSIKPTLAINMDFCNIANTASGYNRDALEVLKWHTIAFVYTDSSIKVYHNCNMTLDFSGLPSNISVLCGTEPMQISLGNVPLAAFKYGYRYFKGKIDDLQIYTRALDEQEVKAYANNLCAEKPVARLSASKDTCKPSVINFTDVSDIKGMSLYRRSWEINNRNIDTSKSFTHTFTNKGIYYIKLTIFTDSLTSYSADTLLTVDSTNYIKFLFPADTTVSVCRGGNISYTVNTDAILKWKPCTFLSSCTAATVTISPGNDISYTITGINRVGCVNSANVKIHLLAANDSVYVPNAFTPNGDRLNDTFGPLSFNGVKKINFNIYNRWGNSVFSSKEQSYKWDGTFKGIAQPSGAYIYTLTYIQGDGCELKQTKGTIQMIR